MTRAICSKHCSAILINKKVGEAAGYVHTTSLILCCKWDSRAMFMSFFRFMGAEGGGQELRKVTNLTKIFESYNYALLFEVSCKRSGIIRTSNGHCLPYVAQQSFLLTLESRLWSIGSPPVENVVTLILVNYQVVLIMSFKFERSKIFEDFLVITL